MQTEIKGANGKSNYAWIDNGILKIQWEDYGVGALGGADIECTFTIPESEIPGIYDRYEIDPSVPILEALAIISDTGRGAQFNRETSDGTIAVTDTFVWRS